jgi:phospholipid transport system substrate-binding protein
MSHRHFAMFFTLALAGSVKCSASEDSSATARSLCDALIAAMKAGPSISFAAREEMLAPRRSSRTWTSALMTRIVVGPPWRSAWSRGPQQDTVTDAFSEYSVATTRSASRATRASISRSIQRRPLRWRTATASSTRSCSPATPRPVQLDYLMRQTDGKWRIIDVFLNGTISELAARRSEYSLVLRTGGAPALVDLLRKKTAELSH